jgi:prophage antirepressor-like protein
MTELINLIDINFKFNESTVRITGTSEKPMFAAKDICKILGLSNVTETLRNIPDKWKCSVRMNTLNRGLQNTSVVTEAGLYKIVMRSDKKIAEKFQEFVCEEILPSIRKTGEYKLEEYKKILEEKNKEIEENEKKLEEKDKKIKIDEKEKNKLSKCIASVIKRNHHRYKFEVKECVYILEDPNNKYKILKIGMTHDINQRLESDRTMCPSIKVRYLMYTEHYVLFEKIIKIRYEEQLYQSSCEWVYESVENLICGYKEIDKACGFNSVIENELSKYNNEEEVKYEEQKEVELDEYRNNYDGSLFLSERLRFVIPSYLTRYNYNIKNKNAPEQHRYCNGWCQDYINISKFSERCSGYMIVCHVCFEKEKIAIKKIEQKELTPEEIRGNPRMIEIGVGEKLCNICDKILKEEEFEMRPGHPRSQCKKCKYNKSRTKMEKFEEEIEETIKSYSTIPEEELIIKLKNHNKHQLCKIIKLKKVGRKSKDTKAIMIVNLTNYFKKK